MYRATLRLIATRADMSIADLPQQLARGLRDVRGRNIIVSGDTVGFLGNVFQFNWNVLATVTRGEIRFDRNAGLLHYCLSFTEVIVLSTLVVGIMGWCAATNGVPGVAIIVGLPLIWLCFVGMNILIGVLRFDHFLRRCLLEAGFGAQNERARGRKRGEAE